MRHERPQPAPMSTSSDSDLLREMRHGSAPAFQALYRRHQGPLYRYAVLRSGARESAADVVQEVFMGLLNNSLKFDPTRGQLGHFLFGVARNLLLKHEEARGLHHGARGGEEDGDEEEVACIAHEPLARLLDHEMAEQVRQALAALPPHHRDLVILYEMHDLSYLEIAAICQLELGTVRSRLSRARAALASRLAPLSRNHAA